MDAKWLGVVVLIVIAAGSGWYAFSRPGSMAPEYQADSERPSASASAQSAPQTTVMVMYTDQGFSPANITVSQGQSIMWMNESSGDMWVAGGVHPTHISYDGTDERTHCAPGYTGPTPFDECTAVPNGGDYTFTFDKVGTWQYHNHENEEMTGAVVVQAATTNTSPDQVRTQ